MSKIPKLKDEYPATLFFIIRTFLNRSQGDMRILLVNDDCDEAGLFGEALRRVDRSIILDIANDGSDALRLLRENPEQKPDLIVIDENGFLLLEKIRSEQELAAIPVTVYTTSTNPDDIDRAIASGASLLPKPTSYKGLVLVLRKKIQRLILQE